MPSRRSSKSKGIGAALERDTPTNAKVFLASMFGDDSPITEKDFTKEELEILIGLIQAKREDNALLEEVVRAPTQMFDMDKGDWQEFPPNADEVATFDKTRGKTSVSYDDYGSQGHISENKPESSILQSFTSPEYNLKTTLGRFNAYDEDGKTVVRDNYDWDSNFPEGTDNDTIWRQLIQAKNLRQIGNVAARAYGKDINREMVIDLGELERE